MPAAFDNTQAAEGLVSQGAETQAVAAFTVSLDEYSGPFDALLGLIAQRKLELTEISLSQITGEFVRYAASLDASRAPDEVSAFIDVASILVEAKSAALLPQDDEGTGDEATMEALRERDLLFARLLQYRAFKEAAGEFRAALAANAGRFPHPARIDPAVAATLPELIRTVSLAGFAAIAARTLANAPATEVATRQLHVPLADLRQQAGIVRDRLRAAGDRVDVTFADLTADAETTGVIVARFMAILAFFKQGLVQFKQDAPFAPLHVRWIMDAESDDDATISAVRPEDFQ